MGERTQALFSNRERAGVLALREIQGPRRHWWFAGALSGAVALHTIRTALDDALVALHPANQASFSTNRLHDGPAVAARALQTWDQASAEFGTFLRSRAQGRDLARLHTLAELFYTVIASGLLLALVGWMFARLTSPDDTLRRGVLRWAGLLTGVYLALGIFDQLAELFVLRYRPTPWPDAGIEGCTGVIAGLLQLSSIARRATLAAIVVPILIGLVAIARRRQPVATVRHTGSPYRVLIALVAAYAVALNAGTTAEQALDALRLWSTAPHLALLGLLAVAWFSTTVFIIARRVGRADEPPAPADDARLNRRILFVGLAVAAGGYGLHRLTGRGVGVIVPGALLVAVGALSWLLIALIRRSPDSSATELAPERSDPTAEHGSHERVGDADVIAMTAGDAADSGNAPVGRAAEHALAVDTQHDTEATGADNARPTGVSPLIPSLLAFLPYVLLGRAILQAAIPEAIAPQGSMLLLPLAVLLLGASSAMYVRTRRVDFFAVGDDESKYDELFRIYAAISAAVVVLIAGWVVVHVWSVSALFGVHGLLAAFLAGTTVLFGLAAFATERWPVPAALRILGLRRWPVVTSVLLWGVLASMIRGEYHEVRLTTPTAPSGALGAAVAPDRALTAERAFGLWVQRNVPPTDPALLPNSTKPAVPMLFVAAQGGGIRAAGFTATTLDCVLTRIDVTGCPATPIPAAWDRAFALSGASGGSVGIASARAEWTAVSGGRGAQAGWVASRLGGDLLSPSLAWQLFVEAPNTLLHLEPGTDRAEIIEQTWERRWRDLDATAAGNPADDPLLGSDDSWQGPLMLLNGTNLRDGCRVNVSRLDGTDPASKDVSATPAERDCRNQRIDTAPANRTSLAVNRDVTDYLCDDEDLRLSTAAFLSARFPFVSPTGELRSAPERGRSCGRADLPRLSIGDGGYRDNTGASAIVETWAELAPLVADHNRRGGTCIVPFLLEIDNGHDNLNATATPGRVGQLLAPVSGVLSVFGSRDAGWIEAAAAEFSRGLGDGVTVSLDGNTVDLADRYSRVSLFSHPGVQAPLGWSLSEPAVRDIAGQLSVRANQTALDEVARWLTPGSLTCTTG